MLRPEKISGKKILFGCLDWGSGHVSRSIPLIQQLSEKNEVIVWCSESQKKVFEQFELNVSYHIGFENDFNFKGDGNFHLEILRNGFSFLKKIKIERKAVRKFAEENKIDLIISDHRYGLFSDSAISIFLTHQVQLPEKSGWFGQQIHKRLMNRFDSIWIMDSEQERLAGNLSKKTENSLYIGHYSRFSLLEIPEEKNIKNVAVISGPEVYAKQFYDQIIELAEENPEKWVIICAEKIADKSSPVKHFHNWTEGDKAIISARTIISRCGYSTLMDLKVLGCNAILIPTPGQLEQENLKNYLSDKNPDWKFVENISELNSRL